MGCRRLFVKDDDDDDDEKTDAGRTGLATSEFEIFGRLVSFRVS